MHIYQIGLLIDNMGSDKFVTARVNRLLVTVTLTWHKDCNNTSVIINKLLKTPKQKMLFFQKVKCSGESKHN